MNLNNQDLEYMENLVNEVNVHISKREFEIAMSKAETLLKKAKHYAIQKYQARAYGFKGYLFYGFNESKLAIENFKKSLEVYRLNSDEYVLEIKQTLNSIGVLHKTQGEYKKALETLLESIDISDRHGMPNSTAYNNIATIYFEKKDYANALNYYKRAVKVENEQKKPNKVQIIKYLSNIANTYVKMGESDKAAKIFTRTAKFCQENGEISFLVTSLKGLASVMIDKGKYSPAESYLKQALKICEEQKLNVHFVDLYLFLSETYNRTNRKDLQLEALDKALECSKQYSPTKLMQVYENLHDYYYLNEDIVKAYEILKDIFLVDRENSAKERADKLLELQQKFESQQKDKLIKQEQEFNKTLQEKNRELKELNEDLAQFNHGVSHDLKEPIRLVSARLTHLKIKAKDKLVEAESESLEIALEASERMQKMLEDLHEFSTLGKDAKGLKEVDLNEVMAIVRADLQLRLSENNVELELAKLPKVIGYKSMYVQLFQNLVNNAIKFKRKNVESKIKISYKLENKWHVIHVQDNGVGIKPEEIPHVFKLFKRLKENSNVEGSGVGLSIVQKIITKMQGEISLASIHGSGTTFIIKLPFD